MLQWNILTFCILSSITYTVSRTDYAYVALLYNTGNPYLNCVGAIITQFWIVDSCADLPSFKYEFAKVGWMNCETPDVYNIIKHIKPNDYNVTKFKLKGRKSNNVYAAVDGIFLHKTSKSILMIPDVVRTIDLSQSGYLPNEAHAVYLYNYAMFRKKMPFLTKDYCNGRFQQYFERGCQVPVQANQFCIDTKTINYKQCCHSQSLMVWNNQLLGVMAWSTTCSRLLGVDPWVFSDITSYRDWILSNIQ